jgi:Putative Ig domain/Concanavalin A-like lectin/glucanases superfamily
VSVLVSPSLVTLTSAETQTFVASGGSSPYVYSFLSNNSGGTINSSTGFYTAGASGGVLDVILVTDSLDALGSASVSVLGISVFQGIGLLKQISYIPAPTISDVGFVLTTPDGIAIEWLAAPTGIPDQATFGGDFLTTDGTTASWAPVPEVLPTQTGFAGDFLTTDGTNASWSPVIGNPWDLGTLGGLSNSTLIAHDSGAIINAAFTAGGVTIDIPPGVFITGQPVLMTGLLRLSGAGSRQSILRASTISPDGTHIPAFAGPVVMMSTPTPYQAGYSAALISGAAYSLNMWSNITHQYQSTQLFLHAAAAWSNMTGMTAFCGQGWIKATSIPNIFASIFGSSGSLSSSYYSKAFSLYIDDVGAGPFVYGTLTTTTGVHNWLTSAGSLTYGVTAHVEFDYNGAFLDVYVGGVNVLHTAITGTIVQQPWEAVYIGNDLDAGPEGGAFTTESFDGEICGWRFSKIVRHTGAGSFTPPVAAYAWDANTIALWNFDQDVVPGTLPNAPWVILQVVCPGTVLPMKHYAHGHWSGYQPGPNSIANLELDGSNTACGLIAIGAPYSELDAFFTNNTNKVGIGIFGSYNFGWKIGSIESNNCVNGVGMDLWTYAGRISSMVDQYSAIGASLGGGSIGSYITQPSSNLITSLVIRSGGGLGELVDLSYYSADFELAVPLAISNMVLTPSNNVIIRSSAIYADAFTGLAIPCVMCDGSPPVTIFENCTFGVVGGLTGAQIFQQTPTASFFGPILLRGCTNTGLPAVPLSLTPEFVFQDDAQQRSGISGLSTTDVQANNVAGTFFVLTGFPTANVIFPTAEPDANYQLSFQIKSYSGSAPAAGSTQIVGYTTSADGFTATAGADPGSTCQIEFTYEMIRTLGEPLLFEYVPTVGSVANPLASADPTGNWAAGITIIPSTAHAFGYNSALGTGTIVSMGTVPGGANWWEFFLVNGGGQGATIGFFSIGSGGGAFFADSFVTDGKLAGICNPGTHNLAVQWYRSLTQVYVDGVPVWTPAGDAENVSGFPGYSAGTQQTPFYTGQRSDTSRPITGIATLRNFRVAENLSQVLTNEPDSGPQAMAQMMFLGDQMTLGAACATNTMGFATQIQNIQYGTTYCWMGGKTNGLVITNVNFFGPRTGLVDLFWGGWGHQQLALTAICILAGFNDLLFSVAPVNQAANIWPVLETVFNGAAATATYIPPTNNSHAITFFVPPTSGVATCLIDGFSFPATFTTNADTTVNNQITAILLNGTVTALVTPTLFNHTLLLTAVAVGSAGNGVTVSTNGANGAIWYTGPGNVGTTYGGVDNYITIDGITILSNFATSANNTVNNVISAIAANGTLNPLVGGTLVASQMLLTAKTNGSAGNAIALYSAQSTDPATQQVGGGGWVGIPTSTPGTMLGGYNGSIQNAIPCVLCTIPPFGNAATYSSAKNTQRTTLNGDITTFISANPTYMKLADADVTLRDPSNHANILPAFLAGDNVNINDAGHLAMYQLVSPLLPQGAGAPTALSYATNPLSVAHGGPISSDNPSVTGTPTRYTVSPALPTGLSISASTGDITGTPTSVTAMATYTVMAANATGATTVALVITIT